MIKEIPFSDIAQYSSLCAKEQVSLKDVPVGRWFGFFIDDKIVAFAGMFIKNNRARIKGVYVFKDFRMQGISKQLNEHILKICGELCVVEVSAFTTPMNSRWYINRGFYEKSVGKNGVTYRVKRM